LHGFHFFTLNDFTLQKYQLAMKTWSVATFTQYDRVRVKRLFAHRDVGVSISRLTGPRNKNRAKAPNDAVCVLKNVFRIEAALFVSMLTFINALTFSIHMITDYRSFE
jgi:hypothetical protein